MRTALAILSLSLAFGAEPKRAERTQIEALERAAQRSLEEKKFERAIAQLEELYRLDSDPKTLLDIALAYDAWGELCAETLAAFDRFFGQCSACPQLERAKNEQLLAQNRCASEVSFDSTPPGAIVVIDGDRWARVTPFVLPLRPGKHEIETRLTGHEAKRETIEVAPKTPLRFRAELAPLPVAIDATAAAPSAGEGRGPDPLSIAAIAAGVAGGIAGTIFTVSAISDVDAEREARSDPGADRARIEELRSSADRNAVFATIGFTVSAAGLIGAALLHFIAEEHAAIAPGPNGATFTLDWEY